jgi:hypothetical protein
MLLQSPKIMTMGGRSSSPAQTTTGLCIKQLIPF